MLKVEGVSIAGSTMYLECQMFILTERGGLNFVESLVRPPSPSARHRPTDFKGKLHKKVYLGTSNVMPTIRSSWVHQRQAQVPEAN